jgi:hypothetical protein
MLFTRKQPFFEPFCADLASSLQKVALSANKTPKKLLLKKSKKILKNVEFYAHFKTVEKVSKIHAQKVIDKNVMEKCTFSTFTHVHQIGFLITFCVRLFCNFFNRSEISIQFCVF